MKLKIFLGFIILVFISTIVYIINYNISLSFGLLGIFFLIAVVVMPLIFFNIRYQRVKANDCTLGCESFDFATLSAIVLISLGCLSIWTLDNYFNPDKHVYSNIDHHAFKLSGVKFRANHPFLLAANSKDAFFDAEEMMGSATVTGVNDNVVNLRLNGFTRPIYQYHFDGSRCEWMELKNNASLLCFQDTLYLRTKNDQVFRFYAEIVHEDSVNYHIVTPKNEDLKSDEHRFLIQGLPLNLLMRGVNIPDVDFSGLHIIRPIIYKSGKKSKKAARLESYGNVGYCVEIQATNYTKEADYVKAIKVSKGDDWRSVKSRESEDIQLPINTTFAIGYDWTSTRPSYFDIKNDNWVTLNYRLPMYHYFAQKPGKDFNNAYVTTSLSTFEGDLSDVPENIILFEPFAHTDNINNLSPVTFSYVAGPTNQRLRFICSRGARQHNDVYGNDNSISGMHTTKNPAVEWIASVEDFKSTSPYQSSRIKWSVFLFAIALALLLFIGNGMYTPDHAARATFTPMEFTAYAVTLYLVTFRWFLLWRASVFMPADNITYFEFEGLFRNQENGNTLTILMVGFVAIILVAKMVMRYSYKWLPSAYSAYNSIKEKDLFKRWSAKQSILKWIPYILMAVTTILICGACIKMKHSQRATIIIMLPVLNYFFNSVMITRMLTGGYAKENDEAYDNFEWKSRPALFLALSFLNSIFFSVCLFVIDGGFGILFFTFSLFWTLWLLHENTTHYLTTSAYNIFRDIAVAVFFGAFVVLVYFYRDIFVAIYSSEPSITVAGWVLPIYPFLWFALGGMIACFLVSYALAWRNIRHVACTILVTGVLMGTGAALFRNVINKESPHTAQRINVHFMEPKDAMVNVKNASDEKRYLQAALNHMIIGEYTRRGEEVSLIGDKGHGYFKRQPFSKVGALWGAQLTDISLVRFVIAEHSDKLPLLFVGLFFIMLVWGVRQPLSQRWIRSLLIQIPLLLMVQSLLIWMATTQRFIFLGQDFPMVSINSRLTVYYYFILMTIWVLTAVYAQVNDCELCTEETDHTRWRYATAGRDSFKIFFFMFICIVLGSKFARQNNSMEALKLDDLMKQFEQVIGKNEKEEGIVNGLLSEYQANHPFKAQNGLRNISDYMNQFDSTMHVREVLFNNDSIGQFAYRVWDNFLKNGSRNNSSQNVLHAHLVRGGKLRLATINHFYNRELPVACENQWRGNIIANTDTIGIVNNHVSSGSLKAWRLPGKWMADGNEQPIVSCVGQNFRTPDTVFAMRGIRNTAILRTGVHVEHQQKEILDSIIPQREYLARNVMVNGHRQFFYPLRQSLFWIRNFAQETAGQKNRILKTKRMPNYHADIALTLSPSLNKRIFDLLQTRGPEISSVMVANGDGEVLSMAHSDRSYRFDPNDHRRISKFVDSLYMYGKSGSDPERRAFGNGNLVHMTEGPGSSQKPLVWTAVASSVDFDRWDSLRIVDYEGRIEKTTNKVKDNVFDIPTFNGMKFLKHFQPLLSDENEGHTTTLHNYMSKSSNVYNAVMAYIGSFAEFDAEGLVQFSNEHDGTTLFSYVKGPLDTQSFRNLFPLMSIGRQQFSFNREPKSDDQPVSILETAMRKMFFRNDSAEEARGQRFYANVASGVLDSRAEVRRNSYAYVEKSQFETRQGKGRQFMENAIRSTAIGASQVWYITPWKMAEAYGRMASLNSNYHLNVIKRPKQPYEEFSDISNGYMKARPIQMKGMSDVLSTGTAKGMKSLLGIIDGENGHSNHLNGYYLYAKTGTIGTPSSHRLGVIISQHDLADPSTDLKQNKYVVVYFTFSRKRYQPLYATILREIMDSKEFKQYMK